MRDAKAKNKPLQASDPWLTGPGGVLQSHPPIVGPFGLRSEQPPVRRYVSVFGELAIARYVHGTRETQKHEVIPLDAILGLPDSAFLCLTGLGPGFLCGRFL